MAFILFLICVLLALLVGECWLLFQSLSQQGRLLLRLEAVEAHLSEAQLTPQAGGATSTELEAGTLAPVAIAPVQQNGNGVMVRSGPSVLAIGDPAPDFSLPDLAGNQVKFSDFRGNSTLVLFWRPSCGFCQRMLADLKAWEERRPEGAPKFVVVSSESVADNQAMGLRSLIVLDHTAMGVGSQFRASDTPMAVLALARGVQDRSTLVGV